ncbi:type IV secretory system conjugative DNA transfer family protein [Gloeothece verrucosa]|uniref:TRAG family protein n=1 Tax=Gloeothece verrucosa (strain PCC 7822) TaxID=497965 RepID=E0UD75_GLOV7|nr:type IV secretion system DNA-binding domain-containing protein [Gloeothece verrucosa]ADN12955.1 TRAG family protein [Gloeothece verrucosa PCC 7822]
MNNHYVAVKPANDAFGRAFNNMSRSISPQQGMMLLACLGFVGLLALMGKTGGKKGKLAKGYFGGRAEKSAAKRIALKQMRHKKENAVSVWVGTPTQNPLAPSPLYLPDAQRGTAVLGAPGTGKTVSVIDQLAISVIEQGFPMILWDFKFPTQTSRLAAYAVKNGYQLHIFAPGYRESEVCNPLEFLKDDTDSMMARQFAEVMNQNFKRSGQTSEDGFFGPAGDQVTEAIMMLARGTEYPDLMMCQALASRTDLAQQIIKQKDKLNPWILASFGQLISSAQSEKTVSSILATANINFTRFMKADVLPAFCGKTTIPTFLEGKQMLVLGLDREKRDVLAPLIAAILHLLVNRNVSRKRSDPLFLIADEVPTLYLPGLHHWLNENREDGLCTVLGFQNLVQMEKMYGEDLARAIIGGCATKIIFNPQDQDSAKLFSDYLGSKEVKFKQKSKGRSGGKASTNISEQIQTKPLFEASDFLQLPTGRCILLNPHFKRGKAAYIPLLESINLSSDYQTILKWSETRWDKVRGGLAERSTQISITGEDLAARYQLAQKMFPGGKNKGEESELFAAML